MSKDKQEKYLADKLYACQDLTTQVYYAQDIGYKKWESRTIDCKGQLLSVFGCSKESTKSRKVAQVTEVVLCILISPRNTTALKTLISINSQKSCLLFWNPVFQAELSHIIWVSNGGNIFTLQVLLELLVIPEWSNHLFISWTLLRRSDFSAQCNKVSNEGVTYSAPPPLQGSWSQIYRQILRFNWVVKDTISCR